MNKQWKKKDLFVRPVSKFEEVMYKEMTRDKNRLKQLKKILEGIWNEK